MMTTGSGVFAREIATSITPPARSATSIVFAVGTAPIHRLSPEQQEKVKPGNMVLLTNLSQAALMLGIDTTDNNQKWGLSEVAKANLMLFGNAPVIFANVFDPATHKKVISSETVTFTNLTGKLEYTDVMGNFILSSGSNTYNEGTDYLLDKNTGEIEVIAGSSLATSIGTSAVVTASYTVAMPELVTANECIGGYNAVTGKSTGLQLADQVYTQFRIVYNTILCPNFSQTPSVAAVMITKTEEVSGCFGAVAICDIPAEVSLFSDVAKYKTDNNLINKNLIACWPRVVFNGQSMNLSSQVAALMGQVDLSNGGFPNEEPANKNLQCESVVTAEGELWLDQTQANMLENQGIVTPLNTAGGWVLWGCRTTAYPVNTDPKDAFISSRRMTQWLENTFILTHFARVYRPMTRRLIQTILTSEQNFMDGLVSSGIILKGEIFFNEDDNPLTDLMDGMGKFHRTVTYTLPMRQITILTEFDPYGLTMLFG